MINPGDVTTLRKLLSSLPARTDEVLMKRRNAFTAAHAHYSMEVIGKQWIRLFASFDET